MFCPFRFCFFFPVLFIHSFSFAVYFFFFGLLVNQDKPSKQCPLTTSFSICNHYEKFNLLSRSTRFSRFLFFSLWVYVCVRIFFFWVLQYSFIMLLQLLSSHFFRRKIFYCPAIFTHTKNQQENKGQLNRRKKLWMNVTKKNSIWWKQKKKNN